MSDLPNHAAAPRLHRALSAFDLLVYGLVFITPIAPWSNFGFVYNASHGMAPLVYIVGAAAMMFTACSYASLSEAFPVAGSVYSYAAAGIGESVGFLAGWALLLDYLLLPALIYDGMAVAVHTVAPTLSESAVVIAFVAVNTVVNLTGVKSTARVSVALLLLQILLIGLFFWLAWRGALAGLAGARFSLEPLWDPAKVNVHLIFGGLSLAALSFLGFDAIATLSEETRDGPKAVGFATLMSLAICAALFVAQTWFASLFVLGHPPFQDGDEAATAFLSIARLIGGAPFHWAVSILGMVLAGVAGALSAQAGTARLIYGMARDRALPGFLAHVSGGRRVPDVATVLVGAVTLTVGLAMLQRLELLTSMVNFGALTGFLAVHASVVAHFFIRGGSRRWLAHLISPVIGFGVIALVLLNANLNAKLLGGAWLTLGLALLVWMKATGRRPGRLLNEEMEPGSTP